MVCADVSDAFWYTGVCPVPCLACGSEIFFFMTLGVVRRRHLPSEMGPSSGPTPDRDLGRRRDQLGDAQELICEC